MLVHRLAGLCQESGLGVGRGQKIALALGQHVLVRPSAGYVSPTHEGEQGQAVDGVVIVPAAIRPLLGRQVLQSLVRGRGHFLNDGQFGENGRAGLGRLHWLLGFLFRLLGKCADKETRRQGDKDAERQGDKVTR